MANVTLGALDIKSVAPKSWETDKSIPENNEWTLSNVAEKIKANPFLPSSNTGGSWQPPEIIEHVKKSGDWTRIDLSTFDKKESKWKLPNLLKTVKEKITWSMFEEPLEFTPKDDNETGYLMPILLIGGAALTGYMLFKG